MKLFYIAAFVDNGMERFSVSWFIFSKNEHEACKHLANKYSGDIVRIISTEEVKPEEGMFFQQ